MRSLTRIPRFAPLLLLIWSLLSAVGSAADKPTAQTPAILPQQFGGWQMQGIAHSSTDPSTADPTNAAVLKEYRFTDLESATYTRDDGRTLKVRAARFADASGAFGAYTFYLSPEMTKMEIEDQGASFGQRVLFYRGQVLVDAMFSQESSMSGAQLRELSGELPRPRGSNANLPTFIEFLPRRGYVANTQKYVMGPTALATMASAVSADLVDFGASAEVTSAHYSTSSGDATVTLISYPTPQLAADHLRRINAPHPTADAKAGDAAIACSADFCDKRTGPIIAIASGGVSESDAKSLLGMVNYEASVTWNTPTSNKEVRDLYMLILNVVILCAVLGGLAIIAGVAFGGFRILMKRLYPDKVFDRPEQMEFISLHLTEAAVKGMPPGAGDGTRQVPQNPS